MWFRKIYYKLNNISFFYNLREQVVRRTYVGFYDISLVLKDMGLVAVQWMRLQWQFI